MARYVRLPPGPAKASRPGLSFIEVLVALFLVSMGAMTFGAMLPMAARSSRMVGNYQQANSLVQHKVDQLRAVGYGRLTYSQLRAAGIIDVSPNTSPYSFASVDNLSSIYPGATGTITVADFSTTVRQVTVTLNWSGSALRQGNGTLTAVGLVARP